MLRVTEVDQRVETRHRLEDDVAAPSAIAPVGPAVLDILLAPEADRARPALARTEIDLGLVEKMHSCSASSAGGAMRPFGYPRRYSLRYPAGWLRARATGWLPPTGYFSQSALASCWSQPFPAKTVKNSSVSRPVCLGRVQGEPRTVPAENRRAAT